MNRNEAKTILLLYRPGTTDAGDPEIAGALALAKQDPELTRWLAEHCARQEAVRAGFRKITAPAGLKEQIISEQASSREDAFLATPHRPSGGSRRDGDGGPGIVLVSTPQE